MTEWRDMSKVVSAIGGKSWGSRAFTVVKGGFVNGVKGLGGEGRRKSIGGWGGAQSGSGNCKFFTGFGGRFDKRAGCGDNRSCNRHTRPTDTPKKQRCRRN